MVYRCGTCKEMMWFKKYALIEFVCLEGYTYKKHKMKICNSCADTLEELKQMESELKSGKDI